MSDVQRLRPGARTINKINDTVRYTMYSAFKATRPVPEDRDTAVNRVAWDGEPRTRQDGQVREESLDIPAFQHQLLE